MIRHKPASKAQTLRHTESLVTRFAVPRFEIVETSDYAADPDAVLAGLMQTFAGVQLAVRSSAKGEDGGEKSMAGEFSSVLGVDAGSKAAIAAAMDEVVESYRKYGETEAVGEIIVQEMLLDTVMSGVVFTHDLNTGAPYYVVNYDDVSGLTDTVTSGSGEYANRTLYIHRGALDALRSERFQRLTAAVRELEQVLGNEFLDIEFALGRDLQPYLLQVRSITTQPNWNRAVARRIDAALAGIQRFVGGRLQRMSGVYGATTVLGQMPDWNPAEMIGRAPRALAMSLYEQLITNDAWRQARAEMGYAAPAGQPLMVSLAGQPFIDVRLSFHSYLPAALPAELGEKLVDAWVQRLRENPEFHDKVEFDVALTCFSFDIDDKLDSHVGDALDPEERSRYRAIVRDHTAGLIRGEGSGSIAGALARIETLRGRLDAWLASSASHSIHDLFWLIDDCIRLGTIPFSILARHAFIARTMLLSLQGSGVVSGEDVQRFQSGIRTVAGELVDDMRALQTGTMPPDRFMARYGHLRPGTYDILSARYDQMDAFGAGGATVERDVSHAAFAFSDEQMARIDAQLQREGFEEICAQDLVAYMTEAVAGREYGKFVFTRSISEMLELIADFGERHRLSRDEMSHVPIRQLLEVAVRSAEEGVEERLRDVAEEHANHHAVTVAIRLPQVLFDQAGVHVVPFQVSQPNFITSKSVSADCAVLRPGRPTPPIDGKIVVIEGADPGFDWIFSHDIAGLITKYGGANSHMAIRCAEFGVPAAIGAGEQRFESVIRAQRVLLDCASGLITVLH